MGSETRTSCHDLVVLVNQAAEAIPAPNADGGPNPARRHPKVDTPRRAKRKASVRSLVVVVPHVLLENMLKLTSTPEQHPVQTLLPDRPHPALRERVGIRRLDRGLDNLDAVADEDIIEGPSELALAPAALSASRSIESSRARWTTRSPLGWSVTPMRRIRRVCSSMMNKT